MAAEHTDEIVITEPGLLTFGLPLPTGSRVTSFFRDKTVVHVSCGEQHSAVVCESGRVYMFSAEHDNKPTLVDTLSTARVTQAACGDKFTVYLTDKGELYVCGVNGHGQLGLGHTDNVPLPVPVTGLPPIKKVAAGCCHTVALAKDGKVWVCGDNRYGQLGLGHTNNRYSFTRVPDLPEPIVDIACGEFHTALILASRVLLTAGWNKYGQLGLGLTFKNESSFKPVLVPFTAIAAVSCGDYHTVAVGVNGTTWAWGYNGYGQLVTGDKTNRFTPTKVIILEDRTVSRVIAGSLHTAVLTQEGDVLMCGKSNNGELGMGNLDIFTPTLLLKSPGLVVQQVAFAWNYSLLLVVPGITPIPKNQIRITEQTDHSVTDSERSIMKALECPVCFKVMCASIHMCVKGHSLCSSCRSNNSVNACPLCREQFSAGRNIALESLSEEIVLPCSECGQRMRACQLEKHGLVCPAREYSCPVSGQCDWAGRSEKMLAHATSAHPDHTWTHLPHVFLHSTSDRLLRTDLLAAYGHVFTLHRRYDEQEFRAAVRYVGQPDKSQDFKFEMTFVTGDISNTYCRNVYAYSESIDDLIQSPLKCVSLTNEIVTTFLQQGQLMCRIAILYVGAGSLCDQFKSLLNE